MADHESLRRLTLGVAEWNDFRTKFAGKPDLTHIEIRNAGLRGADFRDSDFDGSIFTNVDFGRGDFRNARLNGVNAALVSFEGADLAGAELKGSDLKRACLREACLRGIETFDLKIRHSSLVRSDFGGAKLRLVHIYNSDLQGATFDGTQVDHVVVKRGLFDTLQAPGVRACGFALELPDMPTIREWVDWDKFSVKDVGDEFGVIVHQGKAYWIGEGRWDFFISHASVDKDTVARPLAKALVARGQRVWYDELQVKVGDDLADVIAFGARASLFGVVVLSKAFVGRRWTEAELSALSAKRMFLVLHGLEPQDLRQIRPELENCFHARSSEGADCVADSLIASIRVPPTLK